MSEQITLLTGIAQESRAGALSVEMAISRSLQRVAEFPQSAPMFDPARPAVRILPVRRVAALLYTFDETRLIVLRVLHARQDLDAVRDSIS